MQNARDISAKDESMKFARDTQYSALKQFILKI